LCDARELKDTLREELEEIGRRLGGRISSRRSRTRRWEQTRLRYGIRWKDHPALTMGDHFGIARAAAADVVRQER
jgi:hypothetical protein